jgi:hypothetical protein
MAAGEGVMPSLMTSLTTSLIVPLSPGISVTEYE